MQKWKYIKKMKTNNEKNEGKINWRLTKYKWMVNQTRSKFREMSEYRNIYKKIMKTNNEKTKPR